MLPLTFRLRNSLAAAWAQASEPVTFTSKSVLALSSEKSMDGPPAESPWHVMRPCNGYRACSATVNALETESGFVTSQVWYVT